VAHLKRQFVAMDEDGSGRISLEELKKVLQQSSLKYTDAEIQQMLQDLDMSGEGTINYLEFVAAAMSLHQLHSESSEEFMRLARIAFDKFDLDKSGCVPQPRSAHALPDARRAGREAGSECSGRPQAREGRCEWRAPLLQILHSGRAEGGAQDDVHMLRSGVGGHRQDGGGLGGSPHYGADPQSLTLFKQTVHLGMALLLLPGVGRRLGAPRGLPHTVRGCGCGLVNV